MSPTCRHRTPGRAGSCTLARTHDARVLLGHVAGTNIRAGAPAPIVDVMECIEIDRVESTHTPCPLTEHDPLVDIAVMRSTAERA